MSRSQSVEIPKDQKVADWTGFHQQVSSPERKDEVSKVIYSPSIGESLFLSCKKYYEKLKPRQKLLI